MSLDGIGDLNWLAVLVGAALYFVLGALWYSPLLFGRPWQRAVGWDPGQAPPDMSPTRYVLPLLGNVVMAIAVGLIANATGSDGFADGLVLGLVLGVGLSLMHTFIDAVFETSKPQPWTWFAINGSYHALGLLIVAVLVSIW
jgi:hypothetical protein